MKILLTIPEVAEMLGISRSFAYALIKRERVPTVRLGDRAVRVRVEDVQALVARLANQGDAQEVGGGQ